MKSCDLFIIFWYSTNGYFKFVAKGDQLQYTYFIEVANWSGTPLLYGRFFLPRVRDKQQTGTLTGGEAESRPRFYSLSACVFQGECPNWLYHQTGMIVNGNKATPSIFAVFTWGGGAHRIHGRGAVRTEWNGTKALEQNANSALYLGGALIRIINRHGSADPPDLSRTHKAGGSSPLQRNHPRRVLLHQCMQGWAREKVQVWRTQLDQGDPDPTSLLQCNGKNQLRLALLFIAFYNLSLLRDIRCRYIPTIYASIDNYTIWCVTWQSNLLFILSSHFLWLCIKGKCPAETNPYIPLQIHTAIWLVA